MTEFKIGDKVTWTSQAGGSTTTKTGVVVGLYFNSGVRGAKYAALEKFPNHTVMFDGLNVPGGGRVGYFVEVNIGPKAKPRLYFPYPKNLKLVEAE